jgi:archaellum biogenesis protein FlaJ (TadC family)
MCGWSYVGRGMRHGVGRHAGERKFLGHEVEKMSPGTRISAALAVLLPIGLSGVFLVVFVPSLWWIFTTYFWVAFPAFGLLTSGIGGLSKGRPVRVSEKERELLEAIRESGEISAAAAAARTSLTVAEADGMLRELAENGHLEVKVEGGAIFYALWGNERESSRRIEGST